MWTIDFVRQIETTSYYTASNDFETNDAQCRGEYFQEEVKSFEYSVQGPTDSTVHLLDVPGQSVAGKMAFRYTGYNLTAKSPGHVNVLNGNGSWSCPCGATWKLGETRSLMNCSAANCPLAKERGWATNESWSFFETLYLNYQIFQQTFDPTGAVEPTTCKFRWYQGLNTAARGYANTIAIPPSGGFSHSPLVSCSSVLPNSVYFDSSGMTAARKTAVLSAVMIGVAAGGAGFIAVGLIAYFMCARKKTSADSTGSAGEAIEMASTEPTTEINPLEAQTGQM